MAEDKKSIFKRVIQSPITKAEKGFQWLSKRVNWFYTPLIVAFFFALTLLFGETFETDFLVLSEKDAQNIIQLGGAPSFLGGIAGMVLAVLGFMITARSEGSRVLLDLMMEKLKFYLLVSLSFSVIAVLLLLNLINLSPDQTVWVACTTIWFSIGIVILVGYVVFNISKSNSDEYYFSILKDNLIHDLKTIGSAGNTKVSDDFYKSFSPNFLEFIRLFIKYMKYEGYLSSFVKKSFEDIRDEMLKTKVFACNFYMMELIDRIVGSFKYTQLKNNGIVAFLNDDFIEVLKKTNGLDIVNLENNNLRVMLTFRIYFYVELLKINLNNKHELMEDAFIAYDKYLKQRVFNENILRNYGYFYSLNDFLIMVWDYITVYDIKNFFVRYNDDFDSEESTFFFSILLQAYHKKFDVFHSKDDENEIINLLSSFKVFITRSLNTVILLSKQDDKLNIFKERMFQWQFLGYEAGQVYSSKPEFDNPFSAMIFWGMFLIDDFDVENCLQFQTPDYCMKLQEDFLSAQNLVRNKSSKFQRLLEIPENDLIQRSNNLVASLNKIIQQKQSLLPPTAEGAV